MAKQGKMIKCKHCGEDIAASAKKCPHCGGKNSKPIFKRWWFWVLAVLLVIGVAGGGHSDNDETQPTIPDETVMQDTTPATEESTEPETTAATEASTEAAEVASAEDAYQAILTEYSEKLRDATPGLIEEYKAEAANNNAGLEGLAELSNEKIGKLAEISNEGVEKMAGVMFKMGSGSSDEYEAWAEKLMDVYMEEAGKITDAYMESAM